MTESLDPRSAILQATMEILREEGYAAVSSRRVAERAGLKSKLVHYYFKTMDELFLAVYKRIEDEHFARLTQALASEKPLQALWRLNLDSSNTGMVMELTALAKHRKMLRTEIARASERLRMLQSAVFERASKNSAGAASAMPPMLVSIMAIAVSRLISMDTVLGVSLGHAETRQWIDAFLASIEEGAPVPAELVGSATEAPDP